MKKNLISVIINCYNGEKYLQKTLESLLGQKLKNFEVIFVDNCSTDKSAIIFKRIKDKRFRYYKTKKKIKLYASRNFALTKTKGDFISFLDVDDWWDNNFLSSRKKFFLSSKNYGFSFSNCLHYHENSKKFSPFSKNNLPSGFILDNLLKYYFVKLSTIIIKKKIILTYKFNPNYNIIGDYDFVIRIAKQFKGMGFQNKLVNIRIHSNNFTHNNRQMFYKEFKNWIKCQNFNDMYFKKNQFILMQKLEYLRLIYLLLHKKRFNLFYDIIKISFFLKKLKLLTIYFLPSFAVKIIKNFF